MWSAPIVAADRGEGSIRQMLAVQSHAVRANVVGSFLISRSGAGLIWACLLAEGKAADKPRSGLAVITAVVAGANE